MLKHGPGEPQPLQGSALMALIVVMAGADEFDPYKD